MPQEPRGLLADIYEHNSVRRGPLCSVGLVIDALPKADQEDLRTALLDKNVKSTAIIKALRLRDIILADSTVNRHRRGLCACGPR
jgi:hypothetical protein